MLIAVGTESALKIQAVHKALGDWKDGLLLSYGYGDRGDGYRLKSGATESGVSRQPFGFEEMFRGAMNRARAALGKHSADIGIGIESGLVEIDRHWFDSIAVYVSYPALQVHGRALSAGFPVPSSMVEEIKREDTELGVVIQKLASGGEKDALSYLTKGSLGREDVIAHAVRAAFAPLIRPDEYRTFNPNE